MNDSDYQDVWNLQSLLHNDIKNYKFASNPSDKSRPLNHLIFCQHRPVYTLGKSAKAHHLLKDASDLSREGFEVFNINRGGDITYHGPGQLTGYLILDLELLYRDVHRYVRTIESAIIRLLETFDIEGMRLDAFTGVWVKRDEAYYKICAIGVHLSRWVTMHGFALNINTNLDHFQNIVPCGISNDDKFVTSLSALLGKQVSYDLVVERLQAIISEEFHLKIVG